MGVHIKIPAEDGRMIDVEITNNLDMIFYDYDIAYDQGSVEFGYAPSFCLSAFRMWDEHPMSFICNSGLFSITSLGVVSCRLAQEALRIVSSKESFECFEEAGKLIDVCLRNWNSKTVAIKGLHHARQSMTQCWNKAVRKRRGDYETPPSVPSFASKEVVDMAEECANFVTHFWTTIEMTSGFAHYPEHPCRIIDSAQHAIASALYVPTGQGFGFTDFSVLLDQMPEDLEKLLEKIEYDQAKIAVKILGATK
jgi:hypothetical protein